MNTEAFENFEVAYFDTDVSNILVALQNACFETKWTESDFQAICANPGAMTQIGSFAIDGNMKPVSFGLYQYVVDQAEILSFAVLPEYRQRSYAKTMLDAALVKLRSKNVSKVFLEVAADNHAAIRLYKKSSFVQTGVRNNYYKSGEDALILSRSLVRE